MKVKYLLVVVGFMHILPMAVASRYNEPYPTAKSKKGLQVEMVDDALTLGVKHAGLNINLSQFIDPAGDPQNPSWEFAGKTYRFQRNYLA